MNIQQEVQSPGTKVPAPAPPVAVLAAEQEATLQALRRHFVIPAGLSVSTFLTEHRAVLHLLLEAADHLKECFGSDTLFRLRTTADEAGLCTLNADILWPGTVLDARNALTRFDGWWLAQARPGTGYLSFNYELV